MSRMQRECFNLGGEWTAQKNGKGRRMPAHVPGDIYGDLFSAGEIPDPFYRDNELSLQWIGESDWHYARTFKISKQYLAKDRILLCCKGLDTFASVFINGKRVAETHNMFHTYEWNVKKHLKVGKNTIRVIFSSVLPYIQSQQKKHPGWKPLPELVAYAGWVRKEQCNFGWDWGIKAVTCGIWRNIELIAFDVARINSVEIRQKHFWEKAESRKKKAGKDPDKGKSEHHGRVELNIRIGADKVNRRALRADVSVALKGKTVASDQVIFKGKQTSIAMTVQDAQRWWPNGMGEQPLYDLTVELFDYEGKLIDTQTKRIGLRTLELDRHADKWGESFQFKVNGVPFFAKGANWIPVDAILSRRTPEDYRRLIGAAASCNMNMLRVWGGGIYEDDVFYDTCDQMGICVWQDFMFACSAYPTFDKPFMASVLAEARDNIKRLGHHPCMTLWCGNNELEMMNVGDDGWKQGQIPWRAYKTLFDELLPNQVLELSPDIPYWPSSPHSSLGDRTKHRNDASGDAHLWIMGARYPLTCANGMNHRFASEFGFQSFPEPNTIATFTTEEDRNISSRIMELHQRCPSGNADIINKMLQCFRMPTGFENMLWLSQILQGEAVKNVCEHFRRNMPRTMGALYWQLNDYWPVASWSSIDYFGRWKAMQYMARHFFNPVLISGVHNTADDTIAIHLTNDRQEHLHTKVSWTVTDSMGTVLLHEHTTTRISPCCSRAIKSLHLKSLLKTYSRHHLLVWLQADIDGGDKRHNLVFLSPPKHLDLCTTPGIQSKVQRNGDGTFTATLKSKSLALWVWLELKGCDATLSDNFFHLRPGMNKVIRIDPAVSMTTRQCVASLTLRSLADTYHEE